MQTGFMKFMSRTASFFLDKTILFSFDKTGFRLHSADFNQDDLDVDLFGQVAVVTGANSGMGYETAHFLAEHGARVHLLCRNQARGKEALERITDETGSDFVDLHIVDVSSNASIRAFATSFKPSRLDILVNNAGVLPTERTLTDDGVELTWATNIRGPFLLTHLLMGKLKEGTRSRVIFVSSGGMYTQRLDLSDLNWDKRSFDGVRAYANSKRAMVIVNELFAKRYAQYPICFHSMHPGWADTPAVRSSLPRFYNTTKHILRSPREGADTIIWLAVADEPQRKNGAFWFDQKPRRTHFLARTRESMEERETLWNLLSNQA